MAKKRVRSKESRAASRANEQAKRKQKRADKRLEKWTIPREGACEELVHSLVSKAITVVKNAAQHRRIAREKRRELQQTDPESLKAKNAKANAEYRDAAKLAGLTQAELAAQRKEARKDKPMHNAAEYNRMRYANDVEYRTRVKLSARIRAAVSAVGLSKSISTMQMMGGISVTDLVNELLETGRGDELTIEDSDIDHIFPVSRYNLATEQMKAMHWTNLRLCLPTPNKEKGNALPSFELALMVDRDCWPDSVSVSDLL